MGDRGERSLKLISQHDRVNGPNVWSGQSDGVRDLWLSVLEAQLPLLRSLLVSVRNFGRLR